MDDDKKFGKLFLAKPFSPLGMADQEVAVCCDGEWEGSIQRGKELSHQESEHAELLAVPDEPRKVEKEANHAADVSDTVLDDHRVDQGLVLVLDPVEDVQVDGEDEESGGSRHHIHQDIVGGVFSVDMEVGLGYVREDLSPG